MRSNRKLNIFLLILGIILIILSITVIKSEDFKSLDGVCIGIGAGLFGMSLSNLWMGNFYKKHPEDMKEAEIEAKDERNIFIRNKAKAVSGDIIHWMIIGLAYLSIVAEVPLWITISIIGVFILKSVLDFYFMCKYQKEC